MMSGTRLLLAANAIAFVLLAGSEALRKDPAPATDAGSLRILDESSALAALEESSAAQAAFSCFEWFPMSREEAQAAQAALAKLNPRSSPAAFERKSENRHWVSFRPAGRAGALEKLNELERAGLNGFEPHKSADGVEVAMGPFAQKELAQRKLDELRRKNIAGAGVYAEGISSDWGVRFGPWPAEDKQRLGYLESDLPGSKITACRKDAK